jgi:hypothetical protein
VRIDITQADIKKGKPLNPNACAAAQCILRSLGAANAKVHRGVTYVMQKEEGAWTKFKTSSALRLETIIFDRGGQFIPGEYDLMPVPIEEIARIRKSTSKSKGKRPTEARLSRRRMVIPGVRRSARVTEADEE